MSDKTGFLEESPGVKSSARLTIVWSMGLASAVVGTTCYYVLAVKAPNKEIIEMLTAMLATLVVKVAVAIINRNKGTDQ